MSKQNSPRIEGGPEPLGESWWAALLAEEEEQGGSLPSRPNSSNQTEGKPSQPRPAARNGSVDWDHVQNIYEHDEMVCLQVTGYNRGGVLVEGEGIQGFVPLSHLVDLAGIKPDDPQEQATIEHMLSDYVGQKLRLKVIECEPDRGRVVLSERAALAEPGKRNYLLDTLRTGECVRGTVTNVTDFGVFVDLGGVEGLIHVSELSWGRVQHPTEVAKVGEQVQAYVIQVDQERSRIALSLKRLIENPWESAEARYQPGQVVDAVITSIVPFGAFARIEEGLDGLIHSSEIKEDVSIEDEEGLYKGKKVRVRILNVNAERQRLGLSLNIEN